MLLMLVSLLGAVLVMAVGIALVRWGAEYRGGRAFDADGIEPLPEGNGIGGYWPLVEDSTGHEPVLAPHILSQVRDLVREGRETEAVEMVREATGMDVYRAREAVALVRRNTEG
jgi:hypothetical protein